MCVSVYLECVLIVAQRYFRIRAPHGDLTKEGDGLISDFMLVNSYSAQPTADVHTLLQIIVNITCINFERVAGEMPKRGKSIPPYGGYNSSKCRVFPGNSYWMRALEFGGQVVSWNYDDNRGRRTINAGS